jgi:hypothetical protein
MNINTTTGWSRFTAAVIGAGAIAVGVMALSAPLADADAPKTEAQLECTNDGDLYTSHTDGGGNTFESCCYKSGVVIELDHCDKWINGKWDKNTSYKPIGPTQPVTTTPPRSATINPGLGQVTSFAP